MSRSWLLVAASTMLAMCSTLVNAQPTPRWDPLMEPGTQGFGSMCRISPFDPNTIITTGDIFGAAISVDAGQTWQPVTGLAQTNGNNPCCNDITFLSRSTVWLGTLAGPYLSTDGGHTWTMERSGMPTPLNAPPSTSNLTAPIQKVVQSPTNSSTLLAFGGNHRHMGYASNPGWGTVWQSTNGGSTWSNLYTINSSANPANQVNDACWIVIGSTSTVFAATDSGLYVSTNGGSSFSAVGGGLPSGVACFCIAPNPSNSQIIYVGLDSGYGVYESTNGGTTWSAVNSGISTSNPNDLAHPLYTLAVAPSNPSVIYAGWWGGATYYSSNGGSSWTKIVWAGSNSPVSPPSGVPGNLGFQSMSVDPSTASTVMGTGASNVWRSTNSGTGWKTCTNFATDSAYRGQGWSGLNGTQVAWNPNIPGQAWVVGFDSAKQMRSNDYLWSMATGDSFSGSDGPYNGAKGVSFSNDSGTFTTYIASGQNGNVQSGYVNEPIIKYKNGSWSYLSYPSGASGECMSIYSNPTNSSFIWAIYGTTGNYGTGRIYYSSNGGTSWTDITPRRKQHQSVQHRRRSPHARHAVRRRQQRCLPEQLRRRYLPEQPNFRVSQRYPAQLRLPRPQYHRQHLRDSV